MLPLHSCCCHQRLPCRLLLFLLLSQPLPLLLKLQRSQTTCGNPITLMCAWVGCFGPLLPPYGLPMPMLWSKGRWCSRANASNRAATGCVHRCTHSVDCCFVCPIPILLCMRRMITPSKLRCSGLPTWGHPTALTCAWDVRLSPLPRRAAKTPAVALWQFPSTVEVDGGGCRWWCHVAWRDLPWLAAAAIGREGTNPFLRWRRWDPCDMVALLTAARRRSNWPKRVRGRGRKGQRPPSCVFCFIFIFLSAEQPGQFSFSF